MPGRPGGADEFGSGLASGDFDRDGAADLAIGAPGRNRVSVLFGTGARPGRRAPAAAARLARLRLRPRRPRHGRRRLRRPARRRARGGRAARQRAPAPRRAGRPERAAARGSSSGRRRRRWASARGCGWATSTATTTSTSSRAARHGRRRPGHATFCRGSSSGPRRCRAFGGTDGTSGLAVGDVNHDGYADIVQGDAEADAGRWRRASSGCGSAAAAGRARRRSSSPRTRARSPGGTSRGDRFGDGRGGRRRRLWTATPT